MISHVSGTCYIPQERANSSEAEEAPRTKPEVLLRLTQAHPFLRDIMKDFLHAKGYSDPPDFWQVTWKDIKPVNFLEYCNQNRLIMV